jgi:hypothetical protein
MFSEKHELPFFIRYISMVAEGKPASTDDAVHLY